VSLPPPTHDSGVVPNAGEFGVAWIVYVLFGFGIFLWWPALFAVLVCHLRAGSPAVGFLASHYRWLARTFWLSLAGYVLAVGIILGGAWPLVRDILAQVKERGDWSVSTSLGLAWSSLFATIGAATLGGLLLFGVWCWFITTSPPNVHDLPLEAAAATCPWPEPLWTAGAPTRHPRP